MHFRLFNLFSVYFCDCSEDREGLPFAPFNWLSGRAYFVIQEVIKIHINIDSAFEAKGPFLTIHLDLGNAPG